MLHCLYALIAFFALPLQGDAPPPVTDVGPLVHERIVAAPSGELWEVFSTGAGFRKLGPARAEVDLRVGGSIRSHYDAEARLGDEGTIENEILAFEPGRMIAFRIRRAPQGFPYAVAARNTWTVVTLTELDARRTNVRIAMLGWDDSEESLAMRRFFDAGNAWTLSTLASVLETGAPPDVERRPQADDPLAPIIVEVTVAAAREDVWSTWTTPAGWKRFFGVEARIGARPGEPFEVEFDPSAPAGRRGSEGCSVLALVPGELFSFTWNAPPKFGALRDERTWVVVELEALSARSTRVRLRHFGFAEHALAADVASAWRDIRAYFAQAWPHVLSALAARFA